MSKVGQLISKLNQSEQRYLNLYLKLGKKDSLLFKYFTYLQQFPEAKPSDLAKIGPKEERKINAHLTKLHKTILKHLRSYYADASDDSILEGYYRDIEILKTKGLYKDAEKLLVKYIEVAQKQNAFEQLCKAYYMQWMMYQIKGKLTIDNNETLQEKIEEAEDRDYEIKRLKRLYRKLMVVYNHYRFEGKKIDFELNSEHNKFLKQEVESLSSDRAKMILFEIKCLFAVVSEQSDEHFKYRKEQYDFMVSSELYEDSYLNQLLILGNILAFTRKHNDRASFERYFDILKGEYSDKVGKEALFDEKYFDVYVQNQWHQIIQEPNSIQQLIQFQNHLQAAMKKMVKLNENLQMRSELLLIKGYWLFNNLDQALEKLIDFQHEHRNRKDSPLYLESELIYMLYFISKKKVDELDRSVAAFERKLRRRGLNLNEELNGILNQIKFFNDNARFEAGKIIESINDQFYAVLFTSLVQNKLLKEVTL
jgi:hypothetical protein